MAGFPWFVCYSTELHVMPVGRREGGASPLVFSTNFTAKSSFSSDSYDKSSCFLTLLIIHFWIHHVGQLCTWRGNKSDYICPDSCGKQQIWKEEAWQIKAGLLQFWSFFRKPIASCQSKVSDPHLLSAPFSAWFPSATKICVWAASHEGQRFGSATSPVQSGHCSSACLWLTNSWGPSALGAWLLLPQVHLLSHSATLGCQLFHLGNTWHFQPQGLSTDAISKIIF